MKQVLVKEIIIPPEKERWDIKEIEKSILEMEHYKTSQPLNDSSVSKSVTKKLGPIKWVIKRSKFSQQKYKV